MGRGRDLGQLAVERRAHQGPGVRLLRLAVPECRKVKFPTMKFASEGAKIFWLLISKSCGKLCSTNTSEST
jgi:hypothetical protein